jgi:hypothetical protein
MLAYICAGDRQHIIPFSWRDASDLNELNFSTLSTTAPSLLTWAFCEWLPGLGNGQELPGGQEPEVESLMQIVVAALHPVPIAGQTFFNTVLRPHFGEWSR